MPRRPVKQAKPKAKKPRAKPSGQSSAGGKRPARPARALVPQPHGGALRPGAGGGPQPGAGRPPSAIRAHLRASFADRIPQLEQIADGHVTLTLHRVCEKCGHEPDAEQAEKVNVRTVIGDIRGVLDIMAKYGLGPDRELSAEAVKERLMSMLGILRSELAPAVYAKLEPQLRACWTGTR